MYQHKDWILAALKTIAPQNFLVVGLRSNGQLVSEEATDGSTRMNDETLIEQASFRGDCSPEFVEFKLLFA